LPTMINKCFAVSFARIALLFAIGLCCSASAQAATVLLFDDFDDYDNQGAFDASWPAVSPQPSATLSTEEKWSSPNSVKFVGTTSNPAAERNQRTFAETGAPSPSKSVHFQFRFFDSDASAFPYRQYSGILDSSAATSSGGLIQLGLNNNQTNANSGGNYYMARILGYDPLVDGESVGGNGAFFKLNGPNAPLRSDGWHNLGVTISDTEYKFYVDDILARTVTNNWTLRSYDTVRIGSGLSNAGNEAFVDNVLVSVKYPIPPAPIKNETQKLTAESGLNFGHDVGISGDTAVVCCGNNSAYLFNATTGQQLFQLTPSGTGGVSDVAISGSTAILGGSNSAYLFNATTGQEVFQLTASDGAAGDDFGESVAISGNTAIVGAARRDDAGDSSGSAYLFDATTGQQVFKLAALDAAAGDTFGHSVAISGNIAIVGAPHTYGAVSNYGSAYLFNATTGQQLFKLTASDAAEDDKFGQSVAISGNIAIVSSFSGNASAYLYDVTTGQQLSKIVGDSQILGDTEVDIDGNFVAISNVTDGSPYHDRALLYDITNPSNPVLVSILLATDEASTSGSYHSPSPLAVSGNKAILGHWVHDAAYVFRLIDSPGDYNNDGTVDAADYVTWRANEVANAALPNDNGVGNQAARYDLWRANFGNPPGTGSGDGLAETAAVPEPSMLALVLLGAILMFPGVRYRYGNPRPPRRTRLRKRVSPIEDSPWRRLTRAGKT
jgi:hypothetical protein